MSAAKCPFWWVVRWPDGSGGFSYFVHRVPMTDPVWHLGCLHLTDRLREARPFTSRRAAKTCARKTRPIRGKVVRVKARGVR